MPLKKQVVTMPFAKGLNEKLGDGVVPIGELTQAENVSFDKAGQLIKRGGFRKEDNGVAFSDSSYGTTVSNSNFGTSLSDTMLVSGQKRLWARTTTGASERYYDAGALIPCEQKNEFLNRDGVYKHGPAKVGYIFNSAIPAFAVTAYTQVLADNPATYFVIAEVRDAVTSKLLHREELDSYSVVATSSSADGLYDTPDPHVCVLGSKAFVIYLDTGGSLLYSGISIPTPVGTGATLAFSSPASLGFSISAPKPVWDCDVATSAGNATVASHTSGKNTAGCIVVAGLVSTAGGNDGDIRVGYFTNASASATVTLVAVTGSTGTTTYSGTGGTGSGHEAVPDATSTSAVTGSVNITALNETDDMGGATTGQLLITSTYDNSGAKIEFKLLGHDLTVDANMVANTAGVALRSTAWRESDSLIRVALEYAKYPAANGSKTSFRPSDHVCISFEMDRSGNQSSLARVKYIGYNCSLVSESFTYDGERYICASFTCGKRNSLSGNLFTLKAPPTGSTTEEWTPIGAGPTGEQPVNFTSDHQSGLETSLHLFRSLSRVTNTSGATFSFGANRFTTLKGISNSTSQDVTEEIHSVSLVSVDFTPDRTFKSLETPNGLLITGGYLHHYDGNTVAESGFFNFPVFDSTTPGVQNPAGAGGSWTDRLGIYRYRAVYEWYDEMGNLHRSAPSDSVKAEISATSQSVVLQVYVPQFTRKTTGRSDSDATGVHVVFYRTTKNGSLYHRIGSKGIDGTVASVHVSFTDFGMVTDEELVDNELLYTEGGIPMNSFVGSCKDLAMHKERAFVTTSENAVLFSKSMGARDGINFTDTGVARVGSEKQTINAIESAGEAFLIFTNFDGFYITGEGPDQANVGGFTDPKRFAPGLGALPASDHMTSAGGAFIHTYQGLVRILPDLKTDYLGSRAEDVIGSDTIHSMCLDEGTNEARFFLTNTVSGSSNEIVVYHTLYNQLTVHTVSYSGTNYGVGAFYMDSDLYRVTADGNVHKYSPKTYTDNCTGSEVVYNMRVTTGDINVAGLQNAQRVYRVMLLGDYKSAHTLSFSSYVDYSINLFDATKIESFSQAISSDNDPYNFRMHLKNQKCKAVRLHITLGGDTATGEVAILQGLALEVGVRAGTFKLPTAQTLAGS
jgi:hypothetical protein